MKKTTLCVIGAITSVAALPGLAAQAATIEGPAVPQANSFADLLAPISDASLRLQLADQQRAPEAAHITGYQSVDYYHHHHHHHHHYHHHHHHHGPRIDLHLN